VRVIVGIGGIAVSTQREEVLITHSLGSCVGVALYDPVACVGGMAHFMLPLSKLDPAKAAREPGLFADTGLMLLFDEVIAAGGRMSRLVCKVAGGARMFGHEDRFKTSERNYYVVRKLLWKNNVLIAGEEVGGSIPRTLILYMEDGRTTISSNRVEWAF
jgi:chemotaxis protein CheD